MEPTGTTEKREAETDVEEIGPQQAEKREAETDVEEIGPQQGTRRRKELG